MTVKQIRTLDVDELPLLQSNGADDVVEAVWLRRFGGNGCRIAIDGGMNQVSGGWSLLHALVTVEDIPEEILTLRRGKIAVVVGRHISGQGKAHQKTNGPAVLPEPSQIGNAMLIVCQQKSYSNPVGLGTVRCQAASVHSAVQ